MTKIEISGASPFGDSSGIYEVEITITADKPTEDKISDKTFNSLWKDNFHLKVSQGHFSEILGSSTNPIPENVFDLESVWILVNDQFSTAHTFFEFNIPQKTKKQI